MAQAEYLLGLDIPVSEYAHQGRHKYRNHTLHCIKPLDLRSKPYVAKISSERGEIGAPDCELDEVHHYEAH